MGEGPVPSSSLSVKKGIQKKKKKLAGQKNKQDSSYVTIVAVCLRKCSLSVNNVTKMGRTISIDILL